ncbi:MAG: hypothetical protein Q9N62_12255 [Ghiorsea sp.]|nr:hypothetical protein [Ghiorsea sp.]
MLSPEYFDYRWSWYRPILQQGESAAKRCRVDARRLPLYVPGEDAREYVPYVMHSQMSAVFNNAVKRLYDYSVKYMIDKQRVSAHQLPKMNPVAREMMKHLQSLYPHLPQTLLHHWCADENGGLALLKVWQDMWTQSWRQDQEDTAPWVPAVNVLMLRLIRDAVGRLPNEHAEHNDHVMVSVLGGLYDWALRLFLKKFVDGAVEMTRIATYETMIIPATPMAFFYQQPDANLLSDSRAMIKAYGLEPDLLPRMREVRAKVGAKNEAGILPLLARDRMGEHMVKRSWARLALWALAQKSKQGVWMQWVLDAKKLDMLLARPEKLPDAVVKLLESAKNEHPVAGWLLAMREGGKAAKSAGTPWLNEDVVLNAFRVFEEDVKVEATRRKQESLWMDKTADISAGKKGKEANALIEKAYMDGDIVYFQPDANQSLHGGTSLANKQGCLRVEWSDYLAGMTITVKNRTEFLSKYFMPNVMGLVSQHEHVYIDQISASGCLLRGSVKGLVDAGKELRTQLKLWFEEATEEGASASMPAVSMCAALMGDWDFATFEHPKLGKHTLAFSLAVSQADAGVVRDVGVGRLIAYRDQKMRKSPLGGVRVDSLDSGTGHAEYVLYNNGFALTSQALTELCASMQNKAVVKEFRPTSKAAQAVLPEFRLPPEGLKVVCIRSRQNDDVYLFIRAGRPALAGVDTDLYELIDMTSVVGKRIYNDGLPRWK